MKAPAEIAVVATGTANTASVIAALERAGATPRLVTRASDIEQATHVVLPGVGTYAAAARRLDELTLRDVLRQRIQASRPTLAICLGMQLLCAGSEESPEVAGLGLVPGSVSRFNAALRVPQLGWNQVVPTRSELIEPGAAYFANTYRLPTLPADWAGALTHYGGSFASALERGPVLACQFHPELSGAWGAALIARWIERGKEAA